MVRDHQFDDEFRVFVEPQAQGRTVAERRRMFEQWMVDLDREGMVPVNGQWICVATKPPTAPSSTSHRLASAQRRLLMVLLLGVLGFGWWWFQRPARSSAATVPSELVTAAVGPTAPVALTLGDTTLAVRMFDSADGWPNPAATPDAALWGGTTINMVLAVDGMSLVDQLTRLVPGAALTLRLADGSVIQYRVTNTVTVDRSAVEYTAQTAVGLTLVGMSTRATRLIIQAVPADSPVADGTVPGVHIHAEPPVWMVQNGGVVVGITLTLTPLPTAPTAPTEPTDGRQPLTVHLPDGSVVPLGTLPLTDPSTMMIAVPAGADTPHVTLLVQGAAGETRLVVPLPGVPILATTWGGAYRSAAQIIVPLTFTPQGGPVVVTAATSTCRTTDGTVSTLAFDGLALPLIITQQQDVMARCSLPFGTRGTVVVAINDQSAAVTLP